MNICTLASNRCYSSFRNYLKLRGCLLLVGWRGEFNDLKNIELVRNNLRWFNACLVMMAASRLVLEIRKMVIYINMSTTNNNISMITTKYNIVISITQQTH